EFHEQSTVLGVAVFRAVQHDAHDRAVVVCFVAQVPVVHGGGGVEHSFGHRESFSAQADPDGIRTSPRAWSRSACATPWKRWPSAVSAFPAQARAWVPSRMMASR